MAVSFIGVFVLAGLVVLMFLAVLGLVALLTHPKTRDAAKILLGGLAAIAMLVVLMGGFWFVARHQAVQTATTQRAMAEAEVAKLRATEALRRAELQRKTGQAAKTTPSEPLAVDRAEEPADETKVSGAEVKKSDGKQTAQPVEKESPDEKPAKLAGAEQKATGRADSTGVTESLSAPPAAASESDRAGMLKTALPLAERPAWVGQKPYKENSVYCWPVVTDPRPDADESFSEALPAAIQAAVREYVETKLQPGSASRQVRFDPDYAMAHLVGGDLWAETVETSFGPWVRLHALVKFDREANAVLKEQFAAAQVTRRLWAAGTATCALLFLIAVAYCYLKVDLLTGGSRRWLLRFAAILVILISILVTGGVARLIVN